LEGSGSGLILRHYPGIHLKALRKITKNLSQDSRSPGRDLNQGPPEYEAGVFNHSTTTFGIFVNTVTGLTLGYYKSEEFLDQHVIINYTLYKKDHAS
jgi:hypothetical protein